MSQNSHIDPHNLPFDPTGCPADAQPANAMPENSGFQGASRTGIPQNAQNRQLEALPGKRENTPLVAKRYIFTVPGYPKGQPRPRFARMGKFVRAYDPQDAVDFKSKIATFALQAGVQPIDGAVWMCITAYLPRPKKYSRKSDFRGAIIAPTKPDVDNIAKAVMDALQGIAYAHDAQVAWLSVSKSYHELEGQPRMLIEVGGTWEPKRN